MLNSVMGAAGGAARPQFNRGPSKTRPQSPIGPSPQMGQPGGPTMSFAPGQDIGGSHQNAPTQNYWGSGPPPPMDGRPRGPIMQGPPMGAEAPEAVPGVNEMMQNKQQLPTPPTPLPAAGGIGPGNQQLMDMLRQKMGGNTGVNGGQSPWGGMMSAAQNVANYMRPR